MGGENLLQKIHVRARTRTADTSARSSLRMCSVCVDGKRTTVRLEPVIWEALRSISRQQDVTVHDLVSGINRNQLASSLTSAIRAYVVIYLMAQVAPEALPAHLFR